jgi:hypothetical protein
MTKKQLKELQRIIDESDFSGTGFNEHLELEVEIGSKVVTIPLKGIEDELLGQSQNEIAQMVIERVLEEANGGAE